MGSSSSINVLGILVLAAVVIAAAVLLLLLPRLLLTRKKPFKDPVCGHCRYTVAPNPNGLSICPECGKDYREVGILAPATRLPARLPTVIAPLFWVALCAGGSVLTYREVYPLVLKTITTTTINETTNFPSTGGVLDGTSVTYNTTVESAAPVSGVGAGKVLTSTVDVQLAPSKGAPMDISIDPRTRVVTQTNVPGIAANGPWDASSAKAVIAALKARSGDTPAQSDESDVLTAVDQRLSNAGKPVQTFGTIASFTTFSSGMSFPSPSSRSRTRSAVPMTMSTFSTGTSMRTASGTTQDVFIGSLRGKGWLIGFVGGGGGLVALLGLLWIAFINRRAH